MRDSSRVLTTSSRNPVPKLIVILSYLLLDELDDAVLNEIEQMFSRHPPSPVPNFNAWASGYLGLLRSSDIK